VIIGGVLQENPFFVPPDQFLLENTGATVRSQERKHGELTSVDPGDLHRLRNRAQGSRGAFDDPGDVGSGENLDRPPPGLPTCSSGRCISIRVRAPVRSQRRRCRRRHAWRGVESVPGVAGTSSPGRRPVPGARKSFRTSAAVWRCRGLVIPVGVNADGGLVAVACDSTDFPTETDQLLLSVAANHAATAFQSARLIHERLRAEEALRQAATSSR